MTENSCKETEGVGGLEEMVGDDHDQKKQWYHECSQRTRQTALAMERPMVELDLASYGLKVVTLPDGKRD